MASDPESLLSEGSLEFYVIERRGVESHSRFLL